MAGDKVKGEFFNKKRFSIKSLIGLLIILAICRAALTIGGYAWYNRQMTRCYGETVRAIAADFSPEGYEQLVGGIAPSPNLNLTEFGFYSQTVWPQTFYYNEEKDIAVSMQLRRAPEASEALYITATYDNDMPVIKAKRPDVELPDIRVEYCNLIYGATEISLMFICGNDDGLQRDDIVQFRKDMKQFVDPLAEIVKEHENGLVARASKVEKILGRRFGYKSSFNLRVLSRSSEEPASFEEAFKPEF